MSQAVDNGSVIAANGAAASRAVVRDKEYTGASGIILQAPSSAEATVIQVALNYDANKLEADQTPTWVNLKDTAGADVPGPAADTAREYINPGMLAAPAFRLKTGTTFAAQRIYLMSHTYWSQS